MAEAVAKDETPKKVLNDPEKDGYKFQGWRIKGESPIFAKSAVEAMAVKKNTDFIAVFKEEGNILPVDPGETPADGYVKVVFKKGDNGKKLEGNSLFQVKENTEVDITSKAPKAIPKDGYKFNKWDKPLKGKFTAYTEITAKYEKEGNVIIPDPEDPGIPPTTEYVKVSVMQRLHIVPAL